MVSDQLLQSEKSFLQVVRKAVAPGCEQPRRKHDFTHIFSSKDDRQLVQKIESRGNNDFSGLVEAFIENARPLHLNTHKVRSFRAAADLIAEISSDKKPEFGKDKHIVQHHHPDLERLQLWKKFGTSAIQVHTTFTDDTQLRQKTIESFIGITCGDWAVADSATLLQFTQAGSPRSTSLVPSIHIGLIRQEKILASLEEAYCMIRRHNDRRGQTLISGPSKTADIEAHMVHGAHGPREMHVIILTGDYQKNDRPNLFA